MTSLFDASARATFHQIAHGFRDRRVHSAASSPHLQGPVLTL